MTIEWKSIEGKNLSSLDPGRYICECETGKLIIIKVLNNRLIQKYEKDLFFSSGIIRYYGPIPEPIPEPIPVTFTEALRVVLDGGIVEGLGNRAFPHDINMLREMFKADEECANIYGDNYWKRVKPAPKPKMPEKLKDFISYLYKNSSLAEIQLAQDYCYDSESLIKIRENFEFINHLLKKLKPLIEEYEDE